jgi:uncharacterized protein YecE (DUF72 family)
MLENWARTTPEGFRFSIKASRRITHIARLKAETAADSVDYLYARSPPWARSAGPVLFQLPPQMKKDLPRLEAFLRLLPETIAPRSSFATRAGSTRRSTARCAARGRRCAFPSAKTTRRRRWSRRRPGATCG